MSEIFPDPVRSLPQADIPLNGIKAYLSQADSHQIIFMEFDEDVELPEHSHESRWGVVLEGRIDLVMGGISRTYTRGDRYFIPQRVRAFRQDLRRLCRHDFLQSAGSLQG